MFLHALCKDDPFSEEKLAFISLVIFTRALTAFTEELTSPIEDMLLA